MPTCTLCAKKAAIRRSGLLITILRSAPLRLMLLLTSKYLSLRAVKSSATKEIKLQCVAKSDRGTDSNRIGDGLALCCWCQTVT